MLALLLPVVRGQQSDLEIRGKVIEFGRSRGIADVEVTVELHRGKVESSLTPRSEVAKGQTNISGGFAYAVAQEGTYRITVKKNGYVVPGGVFGGGSDFNSAIPLP